MTVTAHVTSRKGTLSKKSYLVTLLGPIIMALLAGCGSEEGPQLNQDHVASSQSPSTSPEANAKTYRFGETHQGEYTVKVDNFRTFTSSATAQRKPSSPAWAVDVTLTNNAPKQLSYKDFYIFGTMDGTHRFEIIDDGEFTVERDMFVLQPTETATFPMGFVGEGREHAIEISRQGSSEVLRFTDHP
ncbi:hypothetical protein [Amycolatopsis cihanbeyliensis]|uniref:DUF4352 domain-containing protein n=1 Tax=Amycolatopsis cihanbeyliensis TaxID=1128664 RepID=A0A542DPT9_AMYCI|nr:hypothetical protein [Amycolatopsis cihanbeyliensis]TQJ05076.1 hypothetical protein FB471_4899 [Amycolatopsis cihanbeyliensis]